MNGFAFASRVSRTLSSLACLILLACALPLFAATGKNTFIKSSIPADLRAVIHHTLDDTGWVQMQEFTEADPGFDPEFGASVALHGTTAMVGAQQATVNGNEAQGAVYVFEQTNGVWHEKQKLVSIDGQEFDTFGNAVVFEGNTAFIGAYGTVVNDNFSQGAVYVFTLADGTWTQTQKITADDGQAFDNFGYSLALNGSIAIIGADGATVGDNGFQGAAYVFDGSSGTWTKTQKLVATDGGIGDIFGYSIAFDGTQLMIGAYANNGYQGAVYAFGQTAGAWAQTQKLVASDGASNTYFGYTTALSGSTLLVGSWGANPGGNDTQGSAYIFTKSGGTWTQTQELNADDGTAHDKFGHAVALQGTTALIGADGWSNGETVGAVYAFDGSSGSFVQTQKFVALDGQPSFQFGFPLTFDGNTALVGSFLWQTSDGKMPGAAYFFGFNTTPPPTYTISGSVSGLTGSGLVLKQNGSDDLAINANGTFTFATGLYDGFTYAVTVSALPNDPSQTCIVANARGTVAAANVDNVTVTCTNDVVDRVFQSGFEASATLAQTTDTTPVAQNSIACGDQTAGTTADNQYWRRLYFSEYAVSTAANVTSVDVAVEQTVGAPDMTVTLYTIPHSVMIDTIDVGQLTEIGHATVASPADTMLTSVNVPITGTIADTVGNDLVVEVSTLDGSNDGTAFYIGSTTSAETHPSFISAAACGISDPTPTATIGAPDMHIIQAVNITN
jgi:hypothetical protein